MSKEHIFKVTVVLNRQEHEISFELISHVVLEGLRTHPLPGIKELRFEKEDTHWCTCGFEKGEAIAIDELKNMICSKCKKPIRIEFIGKK